MFRILAVIAGNVLHGPGTVRLPDSVPCPPNFRGAVTHDPALCLACGICSYVCVGDAITAAEQDRITFGRMNPAVAPSARAVWTTVQDSP